MMTQLKPIKTDLEPAPDMASLIGNKMELFNEHEPLGNTMLHVLPHEDDLIPQFKQNIDLVIEDGLMLRKSKLQFKDSLAKLQSEIKEYQKESEELSNYEISEHPAVVSLAKEIDGLVLTSNKLNEEAKEVRLKVQEEEKVLHKLSQDIGIKQENVDKKNEKVLKGLKYFEENLGLKIERTKGSHLKYIFTCIDEANPSKEFSFHLVIVDELNKQIYKVSYCEPPLLNMDALLNELNKGNDVRKFLCSVRNEFKKSTIVT